jgi:hypothetical protein
MAGNATSSWMGGFAGVDMNVKRFEKSIEPTLLNLLAGLSRAGHCANKKMKEKNPDDFVTLDHVLFGDLAGY